MRAAWCIVPVDTPATQHMQDMGFLTQARHLHVMFLILSPVHQLSRQREVIDDPLHPQRVPHVVGVRNFALPVHDNVTTDRPRLSVKQKMAMMMTIWITIVVSVSEVVRKLPTAHICVAPGQHLSKEPHLREPQLENQRLLQFERFLIRHRFEVLPIQNVTPSTQSAHHLKQANMAVAAR